MADELKPYQSRETYSVCYLDGRPVLLDTEPPTELSGLSRAAALTARDDLRRTHPGLRTLFKTDRAAALERTRAAGDVARKTREAETKQRIREARKTREGGGRLTNPRVR